MLDHLLGNYPISGKYLKKIPDVDKNSTCKQNAHF